MCVFLWFCSSLFFRCRCCCGGGGGYPRHASDLSREWGALCSGGWSALSIVSTRCGVQQHILFYFIFSFFVSRKERKWTIITREEDEVVLFLVQVSRFRFHITWHDRVRTTETDTILILIPPNSIVIYILYTKHHAKCINRNWLWLNL